EQHRFPRCHPEGGIWEVSQEDRLMNISVLNFTAYKIDVDPASRTTVGISAFDADGTSVLENFDIEQIVNHFGAEALLDEIGEQVARRHFDIEG
ncbi:hypothetical protein NB835_05220, partial [Pseudomonas aeruginosa]